MNRDDYDAIAIEGYGFKAGQRIRLLDMPQDPCPIEVGSEGTIRAVVEVGQFTQLQIDWDDTTRSLCCVVPPDQLEVIG